MTSETISGTSVTQATSCEDIGFTYADDKNPVHAPTKVTINGEAITTYEYSKTGNRVSKIGESETTTYESNDDNMIYKITMNGVETQFLYDADSKRVKKTQGDHSTLYFGEDFELINGTPTLYVFAGNLRIARLTDTETIYYHKDHLGSTNAISQTDGTIIDSNGYLPYGLDRSDNDLLQTSSYKFTDQEQDAGTGLYNYDARLYDPTLGQFIMADTLVPDMFNPQSLNRYAYCLNNPVKYTDPSGHYHSSFHDQMGSADFKIIYNIYYGNTDREWETSPLNLSSTKNHFLSREEAQRMADDAIASGNAPGVGFKSFRDAQHYVADTFCPAHTIEDGRSPIKAVFGHIVASIKFSVGIGPDPDQAFTEPGNPNSDRLPHAQRANNSILRNEKRFHERQKYLGSIWENIVSRGKNNDNTGNDFGDTNNDTHDSWGNWKR